MSNPDIMQMLRNAINAAEGAAEEKGAPVAWAVVIVHQKKGANLKNLFAEFISSPESSALELMGAVQLLASEIENESKDPSTYIF